MKKLLSIILIAAMVLSLVPSVFAEGETGGATPIVYDFDAESAGGIENFVHSDERNWEYFAMSKDLETIYNSAASKYTVAGIGGAGLQMRVTANNNLQESQWVALKIKVPSAGIYTVSYTMVTKSGYCSSGFLNILSDDYKKEDLTYDICKSNSFAQSISYATTSSTAADATVTATDVLTAEKGEQEFIFVIGNNNAATGYMVIRNLTLTKISDAVVLDEDVVNLEDGDEQTVTATLASKKKLLACSAVEYSVADSSVADVDATGKITAKKHGSTKLTAKIGDAEKEIPLVVGYKYDFTPGGSDGVPSGTSGIKEEQYKEYTADRNWKYSDMSSGMHAKYDGATSGHYGIVGFNATGLQFKPQTAKEDWVALKIKVPEKGFYYANCVIYQRTSYNPYGCMSILPADAPDNDYTFDRAVLGQFAVATSVSFKAAEKENALVATTKVLAANEENDEFIFLVYNGNSTNYMVIDSLTLVKVDDTMNLDKSEINLEKGKKETVTATLENHDKFIGGSDPSYSIPEADSNIATVSAKGVVTAVGAGETTLTIRFGDEVSSIPVKVTDSTPAEPGEEVTDTTVNFTFVSANSEAGSVSVSGGYPIVGEAAIGTTVEATATANAGYEFAYWRNGAGKVLSTDETAAFKFNTNTAVYAEFIKIPDVNAQEVPVYFYNGNGYLLDNKNVAKGTLFGSVKIANPTMTGFVFKHWSDKDENVAIADDEEINSILRAVAIYENNANESFTVSVNGTPVATGKKYGESVTVSGSENFAAWKLGDKVVSYEKNYTFYVWGDVALTEAAEGAKAPVAVLTTAGGNPKLIYSVPEDCEIIEAGILFGAGAKIGSYESKAFAKESTGQFTAQPNGEENNKTARGYLMFKNDGVIRVIYAD